MRECQNSDCASRDSLRKESKRKSPVLLLFAIDHGGTSIVSPEIAHGQMQTVACPKAGEVQLFCNFREVTERARTPDCGVSAVSSTTGVSAVSSTTMMVHIVTFAVFGFWDR